VQTLIQYNCSPTLLDFDRLFFDTSLFRYDLPHQELVDGYTARLRKIEMGTYFERVNSKAGKAAKMIGDLAHKKHDAVQQAVNESTDGSEDGSIRKCSEVESEGSFPGAASFGRKLVRVRSAVGKTPAAAARLLKKKAIEQRAKRRQARSVALPFTRHMFQHAPGRESVSQRNEQACVRTRSRRMYARPVEPPSVAPWDSMLQNDPGDDTYHLYVMENLADIVGYKLHIERRVALGLQGGTWMDLMTWTVLSGHFELSRRIWLTSDEPLRAAIMSRRLCLKLSSLQSASHAEELREYAHRFEGWAIGLLDEVTDSGDALDLLTLVSARREPGARSRRWVGMWSRSVLDEAAMVPYPCRRFLSHRHCQSVLDNYFIGNYRGSKARIPLHASILSIALNTVLHSFNFFPFFGALPTFFKVRKPNFAEVLDTQQTDDGDEGSDDDELDDDYFSVAGTQWRERGRMRGIVSYFRRNSAYINIPKVKYTMHAVFNLICILLLSFWLCMWRSRDQYFVMDHMLPHVWLEIIFWIFYSGRFLEELSQMKEQGLVAYAGLFWNQVDILLMTVNSIALTLRILSNIVFHQTFDKVSCSSYESMVSEACLNGTLDRADVMAYFFSLDVIEAMHNVAHDFQVLGMILLWFRYFEILTIWPSMGTNFLILKEMVFDSGAVLVMMVYCMLISALVMTSSLTRTDHSFALLLEALANATERNGLQMMNDAGYNFALASAVENNLTRPDPARALQMDMIREVLEDSVTVRQSVCPTAEAGGKGPWGEPWAIGIWATLGEFGDVLGDMYQLHEQELLQDSAFANRPRFFPKDFDMYWLPVILWVTVFLVTIFLVNLMIARMTSTYERLRVESIAYRAEQKVQLVAEFKDDRGWAPPFNLFVSPFQMLYSCICGCYSENAQYKGFYALMSRRPALRQRAREREYMRLYDEGQTSEREQAMEARVADVQERVMQESADISEFSRELAEIKETQQIILQRLHSLSSSTVVGIPPTPAGGGGGHEFGVPPSARRRANRSKEPWLLASAQSTIGEFSAHGSSEDT